MIDRWEPVRVKKLSASSIAPLFSIPFECIGHSTSTTPATGISNAAKIQTGSSNRLTLIFRASSVGFNSLMQPCKCLLESNMEKSLRRIIKSSATSSTKINCWHLTALISDLQPPPIIIIIAYALARRRCRRGRKRHRLERELRRCLSLVSAGMGRGIESGSTTHRRMDGLMFVLATFILTTFTFFVAS